MNFFYQIFASGSTLFYDIKNKYAILYVLIYFEEMSVVMIYILYLCNQYISTIFYKVDAVQYGKW